MCGRSSLKTSSAPPTKRATRPRARSSRWWTSARGSTCPASVLFPKPANCSVVVVDTKTWKIIKKFENIGPDCQTMAVTYDGKYVLQIFSGFQRLSSGLFIFTQDTLQPGGYQPNFGGHHDCVIVPSN